jgi:anaerobic ribonucleoside-triphosphate reductase activating protein
MFKTGEILNLAAFQQGVTSLGPGRRAAIWVQGCPFRCVGCIAPEWIPQTQAHPVRIEEVADWVLDAPHVRGLTLSGGEPMLQARALASLIRRVRRSRPIDVICFTGFTLEALHESPPNPGVKKLLAELDVLIDGQYIAELNDDRGLRGSSNQRIHYLTDRLRKHDFETQPRQVELKIQDDSVFLAGVPSRGVLGAFNRAITETQHVFSRGLR